MSGFVKAGQTFLKALMGGSKQKTTGAEVIKNIPISKNLKKFQENKEEIIKNTDKYTKGLTQEGKTKVRKSVGPALGKLSKITQKKPVEKAKGGRVGRKGGGGLGAQSVKYGLDNNYDVTAADPKAKFIAAAKNKKKKLKKFDSPMAKAVKKKDKKKVIV